MKKAFLLIFLGALATSQVFCQDRIKELGLAFANFESFGLTYKVGKPEALWRFNSMTIGSNKNESSWSSQTEIEHKTFIAGFHVGREFRKAIMEKVQGRYGFDLSFSYGRYKTDERYKENPFAGLITKETQYQPGINAVLGLNYLIHDKLVLGAEIRPGVAYTIGKKEFLYHDPNLDDFEDDVSGHSFNASFSSAVLTLAYRFAK